jgi:4-hydroxy-3-methylbut-2-en-1-yl diphosphate reductase
VHAEARYFASRGYTILYIGHAGHAEAIGTMGHAQDQMVLVQNVEDAWNVTAQGRVVALSQTTLSTTEVAEIHAVLRSRFPDLEVPAKEDICYATSNRQEAVRELAARADAILVVGSHTSSNANRLREVAEANGADAYLIGDASEIAPCMIQGARVVGVTSAASTPDWLVQEVLLALQRSGPVPVEEVRAVVEAVRFTPPRNLLRLAQTA